MGNDNGQNSGTVILSFLVGGVIGAGVALLFAPRSGKETRRKIRGEVEEIGEMAADSYEHIKHSVAHAVDNSKDFVSDQKAIIAHAIEAGKKAFEKERAKYLR